MASDLARLTDSYEPDQSTVSLAQLTDYAPQGVTPDTDGVRRVLITKPNITSDGMNYVDLPLGTNVNASVGSKIDEILNKLTGANKQERYQLWPEKIVREGLTAAGDALAGKVPQWAIDKDTGDVHTSPQMIEKAQEISALAGTGGLAGGAEGAALNATPSLRPALKYKDKIYKGKEGQQHQDVIPKELYPEFEQMAMNGEDISHYNFGFMNHKGQFLDREKALEYAINEGLVDAHAGQYGALTSTLMADSSKPGTAIEAMKANPFYSAVERNVKAINQDKMTGDQWLGTLSNKPGVKPEELQWTGLKDFLESNKGKPVSKSQIEEHLASNKVELKEVDKGQKSWDSLTKEEKTKIADNFENQEATRLKITDSRLKDWYDKEQLNPTKYHGYQLSGGENYREKLLMLPKKAEVANENYIKLTGELKEKYGDKPWGQMPLTSSERSRLDKYMSDYGDGPAAEAAYKSSHWDEPNILAHIRMNDRVIDGKKSLHLEEIQSDWHQQGRDKGYKSDTRKMTEKELNEYDDLYNLGKDRTEAQTKRLVELKALAAGQEKNTSAVPDAPFKKSWHELALKRMIREAAEKGYDRLSWTPGEAQAARYDLSKSVDKLFYKPEDGYLKGFKDGKPVVHQMGISPEELPNFVGKEAAKKLLETKPEVHKFYERYDSSNQPSSVHALEGQDLKIGGEGMKGFYDQIIPKTLEKLGKEHGVKVKSHMLETNPKGWHITPASETVSGKWMVKSNDYNSKGFHFDTKAEAEANLAQNIAGERAAKPIHYIDLPQSLKDQAMRGFPLFSSGVPIDLLDNKSPNLNLNSHADWRNKRGT